MALPIFDGTKLKKRLIKLDSKQQLAFGAVCCERLLPNYLAFQKEVNWGDIGLFRKGLDMVWSSIQDGRADDEIIKTIIASCEAVTPNSEDFKSMYADLAQDVCFSVHHLLDYLLENDIDKIVYSVTYVTDSVDLYVQEIECMDPTDPEREQKILSHHLMQRELAQQEKNLKMVEQATLLNSDFIDKLRLSWNNTGKSNLDLP